MTLTSFLTVYLLLLLYVKGKKLYDPRTGSTAWSDNPALCLRDYLTSKYGLEENTVNIDDTLVSSAANVCDQTNTLASTTRYTCNGAFTTGSTPYDMLSELLKSMGGSMWYAQGKWAYETCLLDFTSNGLE